MRISIAIRWILTSLLLLSLHADLFATSTDLWIDTKIVEITQDDSLNSNSAHSIDLPLSIITLRIFITATSKEHTHLLPTKINRITPCIPARGPPVIS